MTPQDWLMEIMSLIGLVAMFCYIFYHYSKLPDSIPSHFDIAGNPDEFGSRIHVWVFPVISLFLYFFLPGVLRFRHIHRSSRFLRSVHTQRQYNGRVRLLRYQKMILIWGFFYISALIIKLTLYSGMGFGIWFFPVFLCLLVIPSVYYLIFLKYHR
jgi:uncharacterized membrane protein